MSHDISAISPPRVIPSVTNSIVIFGDTIGTQKAAVSGDYDVFILSGKLSPTNTALANTIVIGEGASVSAIDTVVLGANSAANAAGAIAIGANITMHASNSIGIGSVVMAALSTESVAIGAAAECQGTNGLALGGSSIAGPNLGLALGYGAVCTGTIAASIGATSVGEGLFCLAMGAAAQATATNAIALGTFAVVAGTGSTGIGSNANIAHNSCVGFGQSTTSTANNQLIFGGTSTFDDVYFGRGVVHSTAINVKINVTSRSGTNKAGNDFTIAAGRNTGNATPGNLIFQTAQAGSSGSTLRSLVTRLTINGDGHSVFTGNIHAANGTYSLPSYSFVGDLNTGRVWLGDGWFEDVVNGTPSFGCRASTSGFGNVSYGTTPGTSDAIPMIALRANPGGAAYTFVNNDAGSSAYCESMYKADSGQTNKLRVGIYPTAYPLVNAFGGGRAYFLHQGTGDGLALIAKETGGTIKMYADGWALDDLIAEFHGDSFETVKGIKRNTKTLTSTDSPYDVLASDHILVLNAASGAITVNLTAASLAENTLRELKFICINSSNAVTITPNGTDKLFGTAASESMIIGEKLIINNISATEWF